MISLKRFLDAESVHSDNPAEECLSAPCASLLAAYRAALAQMGECGAETCPVMARTADSLGLKDERYAQQLDAVTTRLQTVVSLDDVTKIRASVEESARDLRNSLSRMTAESRTVIDHLRAEVSTYQTKLERAEHIASCDTLTGLGSRFWIEGRIQQRIESGLPFSILRFDEEDRRLAHL